MGRKANPLIAKYFIRGAKLEDASNRYHQTCRACGEKFPRGRNDSLINHLTKKCTSLSLEERRSIVLQVHNIETTADLRPLAATSTRIEKGKHINLPFSPSRQFDGLNALAEASRQVGATNPNRAPIPPYTTSTAADGQNVVIDPKLEVDQFVNTEDDYPHRLNGKCAPSVAQIRRVLCPSP